MITRVQIRFGNGLFFSLSLCHLIITFTMFPVENICKQKLTSNIIRKIHNCFIRRFPFIFFFRFNFYFRLFVVCHPMFTRKFNIYLLVWNSGTCMETVHFAFQIRHIQAQCTVYRVQGTGHV